ncbi:MAG: hypothetical protein OEY11_08850 [Gammaproteobacteria bacterium]|nr:hypothetical protein [Gammaproteobacteria bacterium]
MKKRRLLYVTSLLIITLPCFANRPAEDDKAVQPPPEHSQQSNIALPVSESTDTVTDTVDVNDMPLNNNPAEPNVSPSNSHNMLIDFPKRGMTMEKVLSQLGEPITRHPAVGKPPITRWVYSDRIVFFEYSHVIHVVAQ